MADPRFTKEEAMTRLRKLTKQELLEHCEHAIACMVSLDEDYTELAERYETKQATEFEGLTRTRIEEGYRDESHRYRDMAHAYRFGVCALVESFNERQARWAKEDAEERANKADSEFVDSEGAQCG